MRGKRKYGCFGRSGRTTGETARGRPRTRAQIPENIRMVQKTSNDSWIRDCGSTFVINDKGDIRACDWAFNAWGGLVDGLHFPWDQDDLVAQKVCEIEAKLKEYLNLEKVIWVKDGSTHMRRTGILMTRAIRFIRRRRRHTSSFARRLTPGDAN